MKVGDRVEFVAERGSPPEPGTVTARHGSSVWVDVQLDSGLSVEQVFAATTHFQSPLGNYCVISQDVPRERVAQRTLF